MPIPGSLLGVPHIISQSESLWPDLCTIQDKNDIADGAGSPIPGTPTNVVSMVNIRARLAPLIMIRPTDTEERRNAISRLNEDRQISLFGYYPLIDPATQQATITSAVAGSVTETFRILGVEFDGNRLTTRLKVEVVRP